MANANKSGDTSAKSDTSFDTVFLTGNAVQVRQENLINAGEILFFAFYLLP
jgi:hypothetical protein